MTVKKNQQITGVETGNNINGADGANRGVHLRLISISLFSAIQTYGERRRSEVDLPEVYDVFEELSDLTGLAESTLRGYTNRHAPKFPTLDKLLLICKSINDNTPFHAYIKLGSAILGENA